eukprot:1752774-Amphidinium_carterae.2
MQPRQTIRTLHRTNPETRDHSDGVAQSELGGGKSLLLNEWWAEGPDFCICLGIGLGQWYSFPHLEHFPQFQHGGSMNGTQCTQ